MLIWLDRVQVVVICRDDLPVAELRAMETSGVRPTRVPGSMKGLKHFEPDAFAPMSAEEIAELEAGPIFHQRTRLEAAWGLANLSKIEIRCALVCSY
jgi:hypothetical protein